MDIQQLEHCPCLRIMMRPVHRMLYFLVLMAWLVNGCESDPRKVDISGIELEVTLERFWMFQPVGGWVSHST